MLKFFFTYILRDGCNRYTNTNKAILHKTNSNKLTVTFQNCQIENILKLENKSKIELPVGFIGFQFSSI